MVERTGIQRRSISALMLVVTWLVAVPPTAIGQPSFGDVSITVLPAPPLRGVRTTPAPGSTAGGAARTLLVQLSTKRNRITDTEDWFRNNGLSLPEYEIPNAAMQRPGNVPAAIPQRYKGNPLLRAIRQTGTLLLVYGTDPTGARYLVAVDPERYTYRYGYDFTHYVYPPGVDPKGRAGPQGIMWAVERDGVLYVSNSHLTYARESRGMNAYLTGIRAGTDGVLWRSVPLVANSFTFEVIGDFVVSGYGFTGERDYLYVLNRVTGEVVQRIALRTAPEYILRKGDRLYVRGYNTDFVFGIVQIR